MIFNGIRRRGLRGWGSGLGRRRHRVWGWHSWRCSLEGEDSTAEGEGREAGINVDGQDSWWSSVASGVNDFLKREPGQNGAGGQRRRNRPSYDV